jgi:ribosomal protein L24
VNEKDGIKYVNFNGLTAFTVKAVQELSSKVEKSDRESKYALKQILNLLKQGHVQSKFDADRADTSSADQGIATLEIGRCVQVTGGKYDGQIGTVSKVNALTCNLTMADGIETGNIKNEFLTVAAIRSSSTRTTEAKLSISSSSPPLRVGLCAEVSGGKYAGQRGTIAKLSAKTCRLSIDGTETGNIGLDVVRASKPSSTRASSKPTRLPPGSASTAKAGIGAVPVTNDAAGAQGLRRSARLLAQR